MLAFKWLLVWACVRASPPPPTVPPVSGSICNVLDFGAVGDNVTLDTMAIQAAIDSCHTAHPDGSTVLVPAGTYRTASLFLRSNLRLHLAAGAGLYGSRNASDYAVERQWFGGNFRHEFSALIRGANLTNVAITGENGVERPGSASIVDGVGWLWWCQAKVEGAGMPIRQSWCDEVNPNNDTLPHDLLPKPSGTGRPRLVNLYNCTDVLLASFTAQHSPQWTVHVQNSRNVVITNITVLSPRAIGNTDGIDPESSDGVLVTDSYVSVGDDGISIKSYNLTIDGVNTMVPMNNVTMRRLFVLHRNWCIGSGTFGGVTNVLFEDSTIGAPSEGEGTENPVPWAFKFKSHKGYPGNITNVTVRRIDVGAVAATPWMYPKGAEGVFALSLTYSGKVPDPPYGEPFVNNVTFEDIRIVSSEKPGHIVGLPNACMEAITIRNVTMGAITKGGKWSCQNVGHHTFEANDPPIGACTCGDELTV